jgi:hypothetical protein
VLCTQRHRDTLPPVVSASTARPRPELGTTTSALRDLVTTAASAGGGDPPWRDLLAAVTAATGSEAARLWLLDGFSSGDCPLSLAASYPEAARARPGETDRARAAASPAIAEVLRASEPRAHDARRGGELLRGFAEAASAPLSCGGVALGALLVGRTRGGYAREELEALGTCAASVALVADNARLRRDAHRRAHDIVLLNELGDLISGGHGLPAILAAGVRQLAHIVDVSSTTTAPSCAPPLAPSTARRRRRWPCPSTPPPRRPRPSINGAR